MLRPAQSYIHAAKPQSRGGGGLFHHTTKSKVLSYSDLAYSRDPLIFYTTRFYPLPLPLTRSDPGSVVEWLPLLRQRGLYLIGQGRADSEVLPSQHFFLHAHRLSLHPLNLVN